jgi:hypothetical protein
MYDIEKIIRNEIVKETIDTVFTDKLTKEHVESLINYAVLTALIVGPSRINAIKENQNA